MRTFSWSLISFESLSELKVLKAMPNTNTDAFLWY